jgi:hypothetical protein
VLVLRRFDSQPNIPEHNPVVKWDPTVFPHLGSIYQLPNRWVVFSYQLDEGRKLHVNVQACTWKYRFKQIRTRFPFSLFTSSNTNETKITRNCVVCIEWAWYGQFLYRFWTGTFWNDFLLRSHIRAVYWSVPTGAVFSCRTVHIDRVPERSPREVTYTSRALFCYVDCMCWYFLCIYTGTRLITTFRSTTDCMYDGGPVRLYYNSDHCVSFTYSIQYSNILYMFIA